MTILLIMLFTMLATMVIAGVIVATLAPFAIKLTVSEDVEYELQICYEMPNVWQSMYWLTITKLYIDEDGNVFNGDILLKFWRHSKFPRKQTLMYIHEDEEDEDFSHLQLVHDEERRYYEEQL